jgi:hypothetical protein
MPLGFSKTASFVFDMGCVYIDTCSTILLRKLNTYNLKNLYVGSTIFVYISQFFFERKIIDPIGKFLKLYVFNLRSRIVEHVSVTAF